MREHPIPQDIVGYRFHIVGNMTIKQFAEIGVGVFIAFLLYQTNLLAVIKWPLMAISVAVGAALAFVPFEERPLDHWLFTFVRVLYRPTKYYWKREGKIPELFDYQSKKSPAAQALEVDLSPARRERIKEYMLSVRTDQPDSFDTEREQSISDILTTFSEVSVNSQAAVNVAKPRLKVRVRSLGSERSEPNQPTQTPIEPEYQAMFAEDTALITNPPTVDYAQTQGPLTPTHIPMAVEQVAQDIAIPEQTFITTGQPTIADSTTQVQTEANDNQALADDRAYVASSAVLQSATPTDSAIFNQDLPFPTKPTEPNKLVGMVLTPSNELINDAIVEIKDSVGNTLRAVKTNALGQFFVTTPLPNGSYILETEKENTQFSPITLTLTGVIVEPIEIKSIS